MKLPTPTNASGAQGVTQGVVAIAAVILLACWGLASMTGSLAIYAAGWVAGVGGASATAVLYRMWTSGKPELRARTQTMTLGLVGWLIVIGLGMTLFRAIASMFTEGPALKLDWPVWLLPILAVLAVLGWWLARRSGKHHDDAGLERHANQHLTTATALLLAEAGVVYAHANDGARWADVLAAVVTIGVGMAWSWFMLWRRFASPTSGTATQDTIDPELSAQARAALEAAKADGRVIDYDRLAIEPSPAGARLSVRLHLDATHTLATARESARQVERSLETLLPAGTVITLLEPTTPARVPAPEPTAEHPASPENTPADDAEATPPL